MSRYIDADALISDSRICGNCKDRELCDGNIFCPNASVRKAINDAPTVEVKSAKDWISVKDKMPESGVYVLAICEVSKIGGSKGYYICNAFYTSKFSHFVRNCDDVEWDYNEENDEYYFPVGWWEVIRNWADYGYVAIEDKVVYWMPLPEPPNVSEDKTYDNRKNLLCWSKQGLYSDGFGGVRVGYTCPYCKQYVPYAGKYCGKCGERVAGGDE